jgi:hypothetical protein
MAICQRYLYVTKDSWFHFQSSFSVLFFPSRFLHLLQTLLKVINVKKTHGNNSNTTMQRLPSPHTIAWNRCLQNSIFINFCTVQIVDFFCNIFYSTWYSFVLVVKTFGLTGDDIFMVRAYQRNTGARGKVLFRVPYFFQKCWRAGGGWKFFPDIKKRVKGIYFILHNQGGGLNWEPGANCPLCSPSERPCSW